MLRFRVTVVLNGFLDRWIGAQGAYFQVLQGRFTQFIGQNRVSWLG